MQCCKASTPFKVEEREKRRQRKIFPVVLPCHGCWHTPPHHVEGGVLLQTSSQKATNDYWKKSYTPPKWRWCLPLASTCSSRTNHFFFWIIERLEYTGPHKIITIKPRLKSWKNPLTLNRKKKDDLIGYVAIIPYKKCENMKTPLGH